MRPRALILHADGTNRDHDAATALKLAGAEPEIVPLTLLRSDKRRWQSYQMLILPGGFSHADALGAGKLFALDLKTFFQDEVSSFIQSGKPVLGICNGFQALIGAGLLLASQSGVPGATLTFNTSGRFECRWVALTAQSQTCIWTRDLNEPLYVPVAHGEGRLVLDDEGTLAQLRDNGQIALTYCQRDGAPANGSYPANPNGSIADIAGVCNRRGNVLGLMPHPENHVYPWQHPRWSRGDQQGSGLPLMINGVRYAEQFG